MSKRKSRPKSIENATDIDGTQLPSADGEPVGEPDESSTTGSFPTPIECAVLAAIGTVLAGLLWPALQAERCMGATRTSRLNLKAQQAEADKQIAEIQALTADENKQ